MSKLFFHAQNIMYDKYANIPKLALNFSGGAKVLFPSRFQNGYMFKPLGIEPWYNYTFDSISGLSGAFFIVLALYGGNSSYDRVTNWYYIPMAFSDGNSNWSTHEGKPSLEYQFNTKPPLPYDSVILPIKGAEFPYLYSSSEEIQFIVPTAESFIQECIDKSAKYMVIHYVHVFYEPNIFKQPVYSKPRTNPIALKIIKTGNANKWAGYIENNQLQYYQQPTKVYYPRNIPSDSQTELWHMVYFPNISRRVNILITPNTMMECLHTDKYLDFGFVLDMSSSW